MQNQTSSALAGLAAQNDSAPTLDTLRRPGEFIDRHIGPDAAQIRQMLDVLKLDSLAQLIEDTVPASIALKKPLALAGPISENTALAKLKVIAAKNRATRSFIGLGYYDTYTPNVILRNVLENPGWYTAYTPYQPEISQGRLEALLNFQQMVMDLTGMDLANASMLDEGTAAAEAMTLLQRVNKKNRSNVFIVARDCHPQTIAVVQTRAHALDIEVLVGDPAVLLGETQAFGALLQYPGTHGHLNDIAPLIETAHNNKTLVTVAADIMALLLVRSPGAMGADVVIDYTKEDFSKSGDSYDLILAINGNSRLSDYKRILNPNGIYVMVGGALSQIFRSIIFGRFMSFGSKKMHTLTVKSNQKDLEFLAKLAGDGKIKPLIESRYSLENTAEAMRYLNEGHAKGKVIINTSNTDH